MKSINMEGGFPFCGGWNFSKSVSVDSTFIREMRVGTQITVGCSARNTSPRDLCITTLVTVFYSTWDIFVQFNTNLEYIGSELNEMADFKYQKSNKNLNVSTLL